MNAPIFEDGVERILKQDVRYHRDAYYFLREALDYTQKVTGKRNQNRPTKHVSGQELLEGIRGYALEEFGPMAMAVLEEWGVKGCPDFGELVFNMVETNLLAKTETDSREDFRNGYDFVTAFRTPFLPARSGRLPEPETQSNDASASP